MKLFHTADWHLGKLVQGVYMTEDQRYVLQQLLTAIDEEKPDVVVIAGDLYDRSVPPTEAVQLLHEMLQQIIVERRTKVIAIAGNHDSASRLHFGNTLMQQSGYYIVGKWTKEQQPIVLQDEFGEVHFHLVPYMDPSEVRHLFEDDTIRTHQQANAAIVAHIKQTMREDVRNVFVGHAFVTPHGEEILNEDEGERPLSIGGTECIDATLFETFDYAAFGHLHQAHFVQQEKIRYSGSPLKYSISEQHHQKGFLVVELQQDRSLNIEKRMFTPLRDLRTVEAYMDDLLQMAPNEDYVFVKLLDETPVLAPMEKVRTVFKNAMHVERKLQLHTQHITGQTVSRQQMDDVTLFTSFYAEITGKPLEEETLTLFKQLLDEQLIEEREGEV